MLARKIESTIENWRKTKTSQGLFIMGARQVGKTSSIREYAHSHYENVIDIDFVKQPDAVELISQAKDLDDLILRVTALSSRPLPDGKSLLFFDEVQKCGDAITWMRYLAEDGRFDVIYSGSMLGVEAYDYRSLPVGTIDIVEMFPLDFEEFTWAIGIDPSLWDIVRECFDARKAVPDFIHTRLIDGFARYVLVGGMPEAVQVFVDTNDTQAFRARQASILATYRADITRYIATHEHAQIIKTIYNAVPSELDKENRRFIVSNVDKKSRFDALAPDFDWLSNAGVVIPVHRATEASYPLGLSRERSFFKLYMNDVGLLFSTFSSADVIAILKESDRINFGLAYENAVAQELRAHGHSDLMYFSKTKIGEVDFLLQKRREPEVVPLEVKSGKSSRTHAALDKLLEVTNYHLKEAIVLHQYNVVVEGKINYLPLYMAGLI